MLLFVDNLETVTERRLIDFLDNDLPQNCWIIATGRAHKVRSFVHPKELRELQPDDAARLLRYELKRQGLEDLAGSPLSELKSKVETLYCHPLAVRWFAWACRKSLAVWNESIGTHNVGELETFCVASTLGSLEKETQKLLCAIAAVSDKAEATASCIQETSRIPTQDLDAGLWELECSGLIYVGTDDQGTVTYTVAPLVEKPASDLSRKEKWESEFVQNLKKFVRRRSEDPESPLLRDLLTVETRQIQNYSRDELLELDRRIERGLTEASQRQSHKLDWMRAECQRRLNNLVSADALYRKCAEAVLPIDQTLVNQLERSRILLEAATVARFCAETEPQLRRGIRYLNGIQQPDFVPYRVIGTLAEFHAILGDVTDYQRFAARAAQYKRDHPMMNFDSLDEALSRAESHIQRWSTRVH